MRVSVIGGGSWGTAIAKLISENIPSQFDQTVTLWVYEEKVNGVSLADLINEKKENVKYLPGTILPGNIKATSDIKTVSETTDVFIFVVPHEFLNAVMDRMSSPRNAISVSLIKGACLSGTLELLSTKIEKKLGTRTSVLMGANIAGDVAKGLFSEATLGCPYAEDREILLSLFQRKNFRVSTVKERGIPEISGVLKNVIALGCGIVSGSGDGVNAEAAVIRNGFKEIIQFSDKFIKSTTINDRISNIFLESAGIADLIVTCTNGRNYKYSKLAAQEKKTIKDVEKEKMNGQKLQGLSTSVELLQFLKENNSETEFPLLVAICKTAERIPDSTEILSAMRR